LQPHGRKGHSRAWQGASTGVVVIPVKALSDERLNDAVSLA